MPTKMIRKKSKRAFTLVEMLTVVAIMSVLAVLALPAVQGIQKSGQFSESVNSLTDSINLARSYAMANNTYVYVGLTEVDCSQNIQASPQVVGNGLGRVILSIVATKDGTSDVNSWSANGTNLTQVRQPQIFNFFHIANNSTPFMESTTTGAMALPNNIVASSVTPLPMPASTGPATPFSLPLGSNSTSSTGKYNFNNPNSEVICFNPQGEILLNGTVVQWLEIDVQSMTGSVTPANPTNVNQGNQAALLISGISGAATVYRP